MTRHLSRRLLAATSGLSGSAPSAVMSGKLILPNVCKMTVVVLDAAEYFRSETKTNSQLSKQCNTPCCFIGTMSAMLHMAFIPMTPPLAAESWCTGSATTALRDSCIRTKKRPLTVPTDKVRGAHIVPAQERAIAILCKRITLGLHQNGTLSGMN